MVSARHMPEIESRHANMARSGFGSTPSPLPGPARRARSRAIASRNELSEKRIGRGFLSLRDNATAEAFAQKLASQRIMRSSDDALKVSAGIKHCLAKKSKPKYAGHDLLIEAPLNIMPYGRWSAIYPELRLAAQGTPIPTSSQRTPFRQVHVIDGQGSNPFGFCINS
jgi:hypothetical protein